MILILDNYDSFVYNIVQIIGSLGYSVEVVRNDAITLKRIERLRPKGIIISPGPCTPKEAGISNKVIRHFVGKLPILGVCLGHQCIAYAYGGKIVKASRLMHGKTSSMRHDGKGIYRDIPNPFTAMRYHSLIVDVNHLPEVFAPAAWSEHDELMGIRHKDYPIEGVQFHPESYLTEYGSAIMENFLRL